MKRRATPFPPRLQTALAAVLLFSPLSATFALDIVDRVVASVNGSVITQNQLDRRIQDLSRLFSQPEGPTKGRVPPPDVLRREAVNRLIDEELLLKRSEGAFRENAAGKIAERTIDEYIEDLVKEIGEDAFNTRLAEENQTRKEFRDILVEDRTRQILVQQATLSWIDEFLLTPVATGQVDSYIEEHPELKSQGGALKIRMILFRVPGESPASVEAAIKRKAERVLNRARIGEPFEDLVKEYSEHEQSKQEGGVFSLDSPTSPFPEFASLFDLEGGQLCAEPIRIPAGWCIAKVEDKASLQKLARQAMAREEFQKGLKELREKAIISYDPELFTLPPN